MAAAGQRVGTDEETIGAADGGDIVKLENAAGYVVRRLDFDLEEAGTCCCYGSNKASLDVTKRKARATIYDKKTAERLAEKIFEPRKVCPKFQSLDGIEPSYTRSVPASVIEEWSKKKILELEGKRQRPTATPKN